MRKLYVFLKSLLPEKINIFSNNTIIKHVDNSEINITKKTIDSQKDNHKSTLNIENLNMSDFTFNVKFDNDFHYEGRFLKNNYEVNNEDKLRFFLEEKENLQRLEEILDYENRIVILGNPGIGKTKELENLFHKLWIKKKKTEIVPFYLNIKNFGDKTNFEQLINFNDWKSIKKPCFIIDGLDEISNINNFISELEFFLSKDTNKVIKIIISCRTNIYEKFLIKITDAKHYFLDSLSHKQIENILRRSFNIELRIEDLNKFKVFLENPFTLNLFGNYYKENGKFPTSVLEAFELSIKKELSRTKEKLKNRIDVDIPFVKQDLMKVAFVNELMQQNQISEDNLSELILRKYKPVFEELPFLDKFPHSESFVFRHKNYQEFFAAKHLSQLEAEKIISIIKINDKINKTKPALFNTITFLLNILDKQKFETLKDWLLKNELEILFLAEKDRIKTDIQKEIFQKYFTDIVVEKTFWLGRNRRFSMDKLAEFADVEFLLDVIIKKEHFRSVYSAINVLSYVNETDREQEFKKIIIDLIFENNEFRNEALRCFKDRGYHKKDKQLFKTVSDFFKDNFDPEVNHQIIMMLSDFEDVDKNFHILKNCLFKLYEISSERIKDNTIRGTSWILEKMVMRIKKKENFLAFLEVLFDQNFDLNFSDFYGKTFQDNLIEKILKVIKSDEKFLFDLVDHILVKNSHIFYRDNLLVKLVVEGGKKHSLFNHLLEKFGISSSTNHILSLCINEKGVEYFVEQYLQSKLKIRENIKIDNFRNHVSHYNFNMAKLLENELSKVGYVFDDFLVTQEEFHSHRQKTRDFAQENFEILFDKLRFSNEISKVFYDNKVVEMTWEKIHKITSDWYKDESFHGLQNSVFVFIQNQLRNKDGKTKQEILNYLESKTNLLYEIKNKIKERKSESFEIKSKHIKYIKNECLKAERDFDFENVITIRDEDHFTLKKYYYILKMLYFFDKEFNVGYSKEFYLKTLKYCNVYGKGEGILEYIFDKINNKEIFDKEIVQNLSSEEMDYSTLADHIDYAIKNKLQHTYQKIGELIIHNRNVPGNKDFLKSYTDLLLPNNQIEFLKKCCENPNKYLCWEAVKLMQEKNIEKDFMHQLAKNYISSGEEGYFSSALDLLFYFNDLNSLEIYLNFLKKFEIVTPDLSDDFYINSISKFQNLKKLNLLKEIFDIIYDEKNKGSFDYHHSKANLENIIANLSISEEGYIAVQKILQEIKMGIKEKEGKFFYVNHLIDSSEQAYYNSLSKPLNFKQAKLLLVETF